MKHRKKFGMFGLFLGVSFVLAQGSAWAGSCSGLGIYSIWTERRGIQVEIRYDDQDASKITVNLNSSTSVVGKVDLSTGVLTFNSEDGKTRATGKLEGFAPASSKDKGAYYRLTLQGSLPLPGVDASIQVYSVDAYLRCPQ